MNTGDENETETPTASAGWYPAPGEPGRERYWDGIGWTGTRKVREKGRSINWVLIPVLVVGALIAIAVAAFAAFSGQEVDVAMVESEIESGYAEQSGQRVSVDCPSSVEWDTGGTFKCAVTTRGGGDPLGVAVVSMQNDDGEWFWEVE